jgi:hypothetical protein
MLKLQKQLVAKKAQEMHVYSGDRVQPTFREFRLAADDALRKVAGILHGDTLQFGLARLDRWVSHLEQSQPPVDLALMKACWAVRHAIVALIAENPRHTASFHAAQRPSEN